MSIGKRLWVLVGWWHGSPCAIQRGEMAPPFSSWMLCKSGEWQELRREGFHTRRCSRRPTYKVDVEFQRGTPESLEQEEPEANRNA